MVVLLSTTKLESERLSSTICNVLGLRSERLFSTICNVLRLLLDQLSKAFIQLFFVR